MKRKEFTDEFKEQVLKECDEVGSVAVVARRHNVSSNTIHTWKRKKRLRGGQLQPLPRNTEKQIREMKVRMETTGQENNNLKRLLGEKELEIAILRDLLESSDPR